jgi:nitroreductase
MELMDAIKGRRSIRRFKADPVPVELIREVLDAANYAPSAKRGEQWRFTVLTGGAKEAFLRVSTMSWTGS